MSSTPPSPSPSSTTTQSPPTPKPPSPPVPFLPSQAARIYSFAHPFVLLGLLALRFEKLVADPVTELLNDLPFLALLQVGYVMTCLPPAGSGYAHGHGHGHKAVGDTGGSGDSAGEEKKKTNPLVRAGKAGYRRRQQKGEAGGWSVKLIPAMLSLTLIFLLATPVLSILLVLFGAPLTTHNFETVLCAAHMAVLSATALIYVHGVDGAVWKEVWGIARPSDGVWGGALGTCVGAWFGAVPIPLDWDRPWQAFPITILTGAYIGFAVGSLIGRASWLYGKRIEFTPEELGIEKKID